MNIAPAAASSPRVRASRLLRRTVLRIASTNAGSRPLSRESHRISRPGPLEGARQSRSASSVTVRPAAILIGKQRGRKRQADAD